METEFLLSSLKALLPIVIVFSLIYSMGNYSTDYYFHMSYQGDGTYPPFLSWLISGAKYRSIALFFWNIAFTTVLPYIAIWKITKNQNACWAYLYSGIPLVLFSIWLIPQAIIQWLMLISIINPIYIIPFVIFGSSIHQFWWAGLAMVIAWYLYELFNQEKSERILWGLPTI